VAEDERLDITGFVKLSTTLVLDMRHWIEQATLRTPLSEAQLSALNTAADIIDATTTALAATAVDPTDELARNPPLI